ncbi:hypothetical protein CXR34_08795 [Microbacterium hominis]|uniref:Uncharacterized protein n=1 Tax=Microbacterium hominis TaxID=162426 RepID=A0A2K9DUV0_9MICO|nr:hypothetical protein CXR34_08795 [Microbacterium hominis]
MGVGRGRGGCGRGGRDRRGCGARVAPQDPVRRRRPVGDLLSPAGRCRFRSHRGEPMPSRALQPRALSRGCGGQGRRRRPARLPR